MSKKTAEEEREELAGGDRGLASVLGHIGDGELSIEIGRKLRALVEACTTHASLYATKGKGEIAIKLALAAETDGTVRVGGEVKTKEPKAPARSAMFWARKGGILSAENPRQTKLPLRDVSARVEVRDIDEVREVKGAE